MGGVRDGDRASRGRSGRAQGSEEGGKGGVSRDGRGFRGSKGELGVLYHGGGWPALQEVERERTGSPGGFGRTSERRR